MSAPPANWSKQFVQNADDPFLVGDLAVGMDIWHCKGCAKTWNSANSWVNAAAVGTVAATAIPAAIGEFATSAAGDLLFAKGAGLLNTNDFLRIGWGWYGRNIIDFLPVGGEVFRIVVGSPDGPMHWHLWPF